MTSGTQPEFLRTAEIIYARTAADAAGHPDVEQARARFLAALRASATAGPSAAAAAASTPRDGFDCSIIIPLFNRVDLTEQCLVKLAEVTAGATFEVILVDNASTDATPTLLTALGGDVQVIRNAENLGFAVACNQGARAARGRHLVFLNNDTVPMPGWLTPLLAELDADPSVAVVGSKLLYPDDTIQHAGVVFARDTLLPYHVFGRVPAAFPPVNRRRELSVRDGRVHGGAPLGLRGARRLRRGLPQRLRGRRLLPPGPRARRPRRVPAREHALPPGEPDARTQDPRRVRTGDACSSVGARAGTAIGDEDVVLVPEGWCVRTPDGTDRKVLTQITDAHERERWERVARLQRALQEDDGTTVRSLLEATRDWPDDPSVRRWIERIAHATGVSQTTGPAAAQA